MRIYGKTANTIGKISKNKTSGDVEIMDEILKTLATVGISALFFISLIYFIGRKDRKEAKIMRFVKQEAFQGNKIAIQLLKRDYKIRYSTLDIVVEAVKGNVHAQQILGIEEGK